MRLSIWQGFAAAGSLLAMRRCAYSASPKPATSARSTCGCSALAMRLGFRSASRWRRARWPGLVPRVRRLARRTRLDPRSRARRRASSSKRSGSARFRTSFARDGFNVIGGSAFGDRLENDRAFALATCWPARAEDRRRPRISRARRDAIADLRTRSPGRYVFKFSGRLRAGDNLSAAFADGSDVAALLAAQRAPADGRRFILMDHVDGVEMGVGAYFNGEALPAPGLPRLGA